MRTTTARATAAQGPADATGHSPARDRQPSRVQAWRYVAEHGRLMPGGYDRPALVADLVAHLGQRLAVALDAPLEQEPPGPDRLRRVLWAWLDLRRSTPRVRRFLDDAATGRAGALLEQQRRTLVGVLAEDLAAMGAPQPERSARDLLREAAAVSAREDRAGRLLRGDRAALLGSAGLPERPSLVLLRKLHLVPA